MRTKISIFLIAAMIIILLSCEKENSQYATIPNIRINFSLSILNTPELQTLLTPKYVGYANGERVGYKGHGVYVIKINGSEFRAFDASCTFVRNNESHPEIAEHLLQEEQNSMLIYCPRCGSKFNLLDGNIQSGKATIPLKEYKVTTSGNTLRVYN